MLCHLAAFQYCKLYDGRTLTLYPENRKKENQINQQKWLLEHKPKLPRWSLSLTQSKKEKKPTQVAIRNQWELFLEEFHFQKITLIENRIRDEEKILCHSLNWLQEIRLWSSKVAYNTKGLTQTQTL